MTIATQVSQAALISGITVPDSKLAHEITEFIRDTESTLLFNHSLSGCQQNRVQLIRHSRRG